jgi:hypothetical protein
VALHQLAAGVDQANLGHRAAGRFLYAKFHGFGHALCFLLLGREPIPERRFLACHTIQVAPHALHISRLHRFELGLYLEIFFRLSSPLRLEQFSLVRLVGIAISTEARFISFDSPRMCSLRSISTTLLML